MNESLIVLILKQLHPETIAQFRPICLSNVVIKIVSKVIANRLKPLMSDLVGPEQASFIPDRQSTDNIIIAQEAIHSLRKLKGKTGALIAKIDLEKAYDRIDWYFLEQVLISVGFQCHMITVILNCIKSTSLSVIWNGERLASFIPERGLRQGDPLSPYLFVLCMEILSHKIKHVVALKSWKQCQLARGGPPLTHLFFADDLLLFWTASSHQATVIKGIMNIPKSKLWLTPNIPLGLGRPLLRHFGVPITRDLGVYLGVPLYPGRPKSLHFQYVLDKVQHRLSGWQKRLLSRAARLVLNKAVTTAIPTYVMQSGRLPQRILDTLERLNRQFFWGDKDHHRGIHPIAWSVVCHPKGHGGLGLRPLADMNIVSLAKLAWRFLKLPDTLWCRLLIHKYGTVDLLQQPTAVIGCSSVWRGIELGFRYRMLFSTAGSGH